MARWKACECRLPIAGTPIPQRSSPGSRAASRSTEAIAAPSIRTRTFEAQPSDVSARSKCRRRHPSPSALRLHFEYVYTLNRPASQGARGQGATWRPSGIHDRGPRGDRHLAECPACDLRGGRAWPRRRRARRDRRARRPHRLRRPGARRAVAPDGARTVDCEGRWITPGLIDCHTHLVYAGSRAAEFEARLAGATYEEIARAGGGIVSTVAPRARRARTSSSASRLPRLDALIAEGVTTVEIKSGYGLDLETERKMLRAARRLAPSARSKSARPFSARTRCRPNIATIAQRMSPRSPTRCCQRSRRKGSSTPSTASARASLSRATKFAAFFRARESLGLPVKLHAEQFSNCGGARLAAEFGGPFRRTSRIRR